MIDLTMGLDVLQKMIAYDGSDRVLFEGYATPGTPTDARGWIIKKHFWHPSDGKYLGCSWAGGKDWRMPKVWENRADYTRVVICMKCIDIYYCCASIIPMAWRTIKQSGVKIGKGFALAQVIKKPSKYHNARENGFDSKREERRYNQLLLLEKAGVISDLKRQVSYEICPKCEAAGRKERAAHYVADFVYTDTETGQTVVEDVKGFRTSEYILKRKLMLYFHGIVIQEI